MLGSDGSDDSTDGLPSESEGSDHPLYGATRPGWEISTSDKVTIMATITPTDSQIPQCVRSDIWTFLRVANEG